MRVNPNLISMLDVGIQSTEQAVSTTVEQLSAGRRILLPSDDPYAAGAEIRNAAANSAVDSFTQNGNSALAQIQVADSSLSDVITGLTQAVSLGTEGANGTMNSADRASLATQIQNILSGIVTQANTKFDGQSLFAGTAGATESFVVSSSSPNVYVYQGNSGVNQTTIGDGAQVNVNIPGDQIFTNPDGNVLGALGDLVNALNTGTTDQISNAVASVSNAIKVVGAQRVIYAGVANQINMQENYLSQETVSLSSQEQSLTGLDMASAITSLTQAQTAHSAVLAAAAKVLPVSLLDYLK